MDAAALIRRMNGQPLTVTRRGAGVVTNGIVAEGPSSTLPIVAGVQPASGRDLQRLPEGRRSTATLVLYTVTPLLVGNAGAANEADVVTIDGEEWEVQHVEHWRRSGYYRVIVQAVA